MNLFLFCALSAFSVHDTSVSVPSQKNLSAFTLVITEIMADPDPALGLPAHEYCEILNRSSLPVDLTGWTFYDGSSRILPPVIINPGEYFIICNDDDTAAFAGFGNYAAVSSISLTNSGEKIALRDPTGMATDSVIYSDTWLGSSYKKDGGWSLEKIDPDFTCPVSNNWTVSLNPSGGTPGTINSVNGVIEDMTKPVLLRGYCTDSVTVILIFNEALEPSNALMIQNYMLLPNSIPTAVNFEDEFLKTIQLTFSDPVIYGSIKTIQVSEVTDCSGNEIAINAATRIGIADTLPENKIVINEILFNPYEGGYDFIELYHSGKSIVDLNEYNISTLDGETGLLNESEKIADNPWLMFPGDYIVITENVYSVSSQYKTSYPYNFIETANLPSMNVDEGNIIISRNDNYIDGLFYSDKYHFELIENNKGISLEKINPSFKSSDPFSWHSAAASFGYATPGLKNSQFAEINFSESEITLSPEIFSPDNDGSDDVVKIIMNSKKPGYISNIRIYSSDGIIVYDYSKNKLLATEDAYIWDGITGVNTRAPAGIYIAYVEVFHLNGELKNFKMPFVLAVKP